MKYVIPVVIIVLALLAANGIYVVNQGHAALLTRLGQVQASDVGPGLHFKLPFVEEVTTYDTRAIVLRSEPEDYKTSDGDPVRVGFFVRWQVADPDAWFKATTGNDLQVTQQMTPVIRTALRTEIAKHSQAELLATDDGPIDQALRDAVSGNLRQRLGVTILDVGVERVLPPDDALKSVYARMSAEADAQAGEVRDKSDAAAAAIRAKGGAADQKVVAAAAKEAAVVRGQGDAEAAKIYATASAQDPQFFRYWSSLETWRDSFSGGGAVVVLDRNSPFMQAIDEGAAAGGSSPKKH
ncbi:MAG TPA: protease modulator HflC [Rhodanobacteraceae bacterium]|jgi:membrane protease subunit HflC|nr:protease modulator HflC [Rhodanobacteraceae bacterium]